ncbi:MAG: RagB/SusD family nutrient uptake outer membrane protein [Cytophagales bacterium]|nr:RagB/SusD family nutrient uptake outer membrane protein [Cytophagales bacterium]
MKRTIYYLTTRILIGSVLIGISFLLPSCEDFVDIDPPITEIVSEDVFDNDAIATAAISGIYTEMFRAQAFTHTLTLNNGRAADEFINFSSDVSFQAFFDNGLDPMNPNLETYWNEFYGYIHSANAIIEGLANSTGVTIEIKEQLEGEAKFIRALCHFYLVNLWGDVPLITTTDFQTNSRVSRTASAQVYEQIIQDLIEAQNLLAEDYSFSGGQRGRPNKSAASALLSRVYLYVGDWQNAEESASEVIINSNYNLASDLNEVFLLNSSETIWQLWSVFSGGGINTFDGELLIFSATPTNVALRDDLLNSFETGDERGANWVGSFSDGTDTWYYPFKYKVQDGNQGVPITEALSMLRLAEQFLIRAEARAQQGNVTGSQDDLNMIRNRAGLTNTTSNDQTSLLAAIEQERRVELFAENSHRWLDLKRTGRTDAVLGVVKPNWQNTDVLYPLPRADFDKNSNLRPQNPGY